MFIKLFAIIAILSVVCANKNTSPNLKFLENDPALCCQTCEGAQEKYYSIDPIFNLCGECCMKPSWFWVYKIFEWSLNKAETNSPCADRDYTIYKNTPTHGVYPITMTLDLYAPTPKKTEN